MCSFSSQVNNLAVTAVVLLAVRQLPRLFLIQESLPRKAKCDYGKRTLSPNASIVFLCRFSTTQIYFLEQRRNKLSVFYRTLLESLFIEKKSSFFYKFLLLAKQIVWRRFSFSGIFLKVS